VHRNWFGVASSVLHERFQTWQANGLFLKMMKLMLKFYKKKRRIKWKWQALDSKSCPAPLGGTETGKNPTDRAKSGAKLHLLVDKRGAPLAVHITGANEHDKWSADDLIISIVVPRPQTKEQHLCADKGYDSQDVHEFVEQAHYIAHIKHRRRRGEPIVEECPDTGRNPTPCTTLGCGTYSGLAH
jgi:putative transposase